MEQTKTWHFGKGQVCKNTNLASFRTGLPKGDVIRDFLKEVVTFSRHMKMIIHVVWFQPTKICKTKLSDMQDSWLTNEAENLVLLTKQEEVPRRTKSICDQKRYGATPDRAEEVNTPECLQINPTAEKPTQHDKPTPNKVKQEFHLNHRLRTVSTVASYRVDGGVGVEFFLREISPARPRSEFTLFLLTIQAY